MRLKMRSARKKLENACATLMPKILPPITYAYAGKTIKRLARSAAPVAIKHAAERESNTVFNPLWKR